jgi:hypothetical protein
MPAVSSKIPALAARRPDRTGLLPFHARRSGAGLKAGLIAAFGSRRMSGGELP